MKSGEPFNPWRGDERTPGCGFYPPEVVNMQRSLTDGPKRVYERLVRFAGRDGHCYPSQEKLAEVLGKSSRQIRRDLETLEAAKLIEHRNRDGRRSNTYVFLWHQMFDEKKAAHPKAPAAEDLSGHGCPVNGSVERTPTSGQSENLSGRLRPVKDFERTYMVNLSGHGCPTNTAQRIKCTLSESALNLSEEFRQRYPECKSGVKVESACGAYVSRIHVTPGEHDKLMAGLDRYLASVDWQRALADDPAGRFIPSMERFIADGLYLDRPPPAQERREDDGYMTEAVAKRRREAELAQEDALAEGASQLEARRRYDAVLGQGAWA
jgi:hypothetical protein